MKKTGETLSGTISGVVNGSAQVVTRTSTGGTAKFPVLLSEIKSVTMAVPPAVAKVQAPSTPPGEVIAALDAPVKQFAGLQAPWVVDAMGRLGDAYSQVGQADKAAAVYNQIGTLYPGSAYVAVADASRAQMSFDSGKVEDAMSIVRPLVEKANQDIAPSATDGSAYAKAFIVYGRGLQAEKKFPEALEAFLTVKTMFYQNPALVAEADHYAQDLRAKNKDIGIE